MKTWKVIVLMVVALIVGVALGVGYTRTIKKAPAPAAPAEEATMLDLKVDAPAVKAEAVVPAKADDPVKTEDKKLREKEAK